MASTGKSDESIITEVLKAEEERCQAIADKRVDDLASMLTDDFIYTHASGNVHDKEGHLALAGHRQRFLNRSKLAVRPFGDVAVMTGELTMVFPTEDEGGTDEVNHYFVVQVWTWNESRWQLAMYQSSKGATSV